MDMPRTDARNTDKVSWSRRQTGGRTRPNAVPAPLKRSVKIPASRYDGGSPASATTTPRRESTTAVQRIYLASDIFVQIDLSAVMYLLGIVLIYGT